MKISFRDKLMSTSRNRDEFHWRLAKWLTLIDVEKTVAVVLALLEAALIDIENGVFRENRCLCTDRDGVRPAVACETISVDRLIRTVGMKIDAGQIWFWSAAAHHRGHHRRAKFWKAINFLLFRSLPPHEAILAEPVRLEHYGLCSVIHPNVTIGRRVRIFHHVTLASESVIGSEHRIFVGDDVVTGVGAIVVGQGNRSLRIGDRATIGAGAVVTRDVEPGQTVVGVPAAPLSAPRVDGLI